MIEFDVDMGCLLECDELDKVVLNDENGEHEPMEFVPADVTVGVGTCKDVCASASEFTCSECGFNCELTSWISLFDGDDGRHRHHHHGTPNYCPNCGAMVVSA